MYTTSTQVAATTPTITLQASFQSSASQPNKRFNSVLVVGGSGTLGTCIVQALHQQGYKIHLLSRNPDDLQAKHPKLVGLAEGIVHGNLLASLEGICNGIDAVISCAGAAMDINNIRNKTSFYEVDYQGNLRLLSEAQRAGTAKFVYVSAFGAQTLRSEYTDAHEAFATALQHSGMPHTVVRPTGFFSFMGEFVQMARRGAGFVVGSGTARTNPIHEADVAALCIQALFCDEPSIDCGGPDIFTREEIVRLAFQAVGKKPRITHVPARMYSVLPTLAKPFNPRIAALLDFGGKVSLYDCIAPQRGERRLLDYFTALAATMR
jgi:uncharacterized protein YbjT (DUF2867 family)